VFFDSHVEGVVGEGHGWMIMGEFIWDMDFQFAIWLFSISL
jgi:hypothetical protein